MLQPKQLSPWLTVVRESCGEHAVLSDGWQHIRLDIEAGSLIDADAVVLHYRLAGLASATPKILSLRRLLDLIRQRKFARTLYPRDRRIERWLAALRVHDALQAGASQNEIVRELYGIDGAVIGAARADSLRSRVRRLVAEARKLSSGDYRTLLIRGAHARD